MTKKEFDKLRRLSRQSYRTFCTLPEEIGKSIRLQCTVGYGLLFATVKGWLADMDDDAKKHVEGIIHVIKYERRKLLEKPSATEPDAEQS